MSKRGDGGTRELNLKEIDQAHEVLSDLNDGLIGIQGLPRTTPEAMPTNDGEATFSPDQLAKDDTNRTLVGDYVAGNPEYQADIYLALDEFERYAAVATSVREDRDADGAFRGNHYKALNGKRLGDYIALIGWNDKSQAFEIEGIGQVTEIRSNGAADLTFARRSGDGRIVPHRDLSIVSLDHRLAEPSQFLARIPKRRVDSIRAERSE